MPVSLWFGNVQREMPSNDSAIKFKLKNNEHVILDSFIIIFSTFHFSTQQPFPRGRVAECVYMHMILQVLKKKLICVPVQQNLPHGGDFETAENEILWSNYFFGVFRFITD